MGHITIFTLTDCPRCKAAEALLAELGFPAEGLVVVDVQKESWKKRQLPSLLPSTGKAAPLTLPQIFLGTEHIGGNSELQAMHAKGGLAPKLKAVLEGPKLDFPPPFPEPSKEELLAEVPASFRAKWTKSLNMLDKAVGGGISSLLIMLEGPQEMIVLCTAGEESAVATFIPDAAGPKGPANSKVMSYCQVVLEKDKTLFIDDPSNFPGLERNGDYVKYGYGYYIGAPWRQPGGTLTGTIAIMEKVAGKFRPEHVVVVNLFRDLFEQDISMVTSSIHQ